MDALDQRLTDLERRLAEFEHARVPGRPATGRINGVPTEPPNGGKPFPAVQYLLDEHGDSGIQGIMAFSGYHRISEPETSRFFQWQLKLTTDDVLAMDDTRNVRVLSALANPIRLRMMKEILEHPGTAAELRERLGLTSTGQTYHALNALVNGGMIQQEQDGTFVANGDKACAFLILLGGLYELTEGKYDAAFATAMTEPDGSESRDS
jgi:DNA-binding transcriptional ArsR family regulator